MPGGPHFFDDLGADRAQAIQAVSMDMSPAFRKSVSTHAGQAVICYDPFYRVVRVMPMLGREVLVGNELGFLWSAYYRDWR